MIIIINNNNDNNNNLPKTATLTTMAPTMTMTIASNNQDK